MFAAAQGRLGLVTVLLAGGANAEATAGDGSRAWDVARDEEVRRMLQDRGGKK
jgi:hypothetical protein